MTQTRDEKLAYARGYNRGRARSSDWSLKLTRLAKAYRARTQAEPVRRCGACIRWTRGGDTCLWGYCGADFDTVAEPWAAAEYFIGDREEGRRLVTSEGFGCVNWLPLPDGALGRQDAAADDATGAEGDRRDTPDNA